MTGFFFRISWSEMTPYTYVSAGRRFRISLFCWWRCFVRPVIKQKTEYAEQTIMVMIISLQWLTIFIFLLSPVNKRNSLFGYIGGGPVFFGLLLLFFECEIVTICRSENKNSNEEPGLVPKLPHRISLILVLWIFPLALPEIEILKNKSVLHGRDKGIWDNFPTTS